MSIIATLLSFAMSATVGMGDCVPKRVAALDLGGASLLSQQAASSTGAQYIDAGGVTIFVAEDGSVIKKEMDMRRGGTFLGLSKTSDVKDAKAAFRRNGLGRHFVFLPSRGETVATTGLCLISSAKFEYEFYLIFGEDGKLRVIGERIAAD